MYIGIPKFEEAVATKVDFSTTSDAPFLNERFTIKKTFPLPVSIGENCASVGALPELAVMFVSLTRIEAPAGNEPMKTSAPSLPTNDCTRIDIVGEEDTLPKLLCSLLSKTIAAPSSSTRFLTVTIRIPAPRLLACTIIAPTLRVIVMLPCAVTFANTTFVQDVLIVSLPSGSVVLVMMQGMTANDGWTMITRSSEQEMTAFIIDHAFLFFLDLG